jgi:hypothetical protein
VRRPVLVFEGARGYGKTALIDMLAQQCDQRVPHARISLEEYRAATVPEVLSAIAFQLSKIYERYGSLRFSLLAIGLRVIEADLPADRPAARDAVKDLLAAEVDLDGVREILWNAAGAVKPELGPYVRFGVGIMLEAMRRVVRRVRSLDPSWYGHRDRGDLNSPYDVLVDLHFWAKEKRTSEVNELLWEAFLADLRENFRESRHAAEMTLNCLLLLDDADIPLGQKLVKGLVEVRRNRLELGVEAADPLTVVVTSRGELLSDVRNEPDWWLPYTLPDLSERETGALVSARSSQTGSRAQLIGNHQVTSMVYGFTGGHPASTALLVEAMGERPLEHGDTLAVLLDRQALGDRLRQQLLGEFTDDTYADLVTCAAARTQQHAGLLAAHGKLLAGGIDSYEEIVPVLWPPFGGAGPVVLRRLLLRELAARSGDDAPSWTRIADWFRARCAAEGDEDEALHYAMMGGDITSACEGLRKRLAGDPTEWVRLLRSVTSMPRLPINPAVSPMDQLRAAVDARSPRLARLVVALSIAGDPLASNRRRALHLQIAADYNFVAGLGQGDPEPLLNQAHYHHKQAEFWS